MNKHEIPEVEESEKVQVLTSIWMVPLIALLIALWLAWQYFSQLGPKVQIVFETSGGLKAGQSQVKMRDVPIGIVKNITLLDGKKGVVVTVQLDKDAEAYLNKETKFWVARPKIDTKGISGLDTLMSGAYLAMYGDKGEGGQNYFVGLEEPYIDKEALMGKRYTLSAPDARDLSAGANVYYRKIKVGNLESVRLAQDGEKVNFTVFIEEPYTKFVNSKTQFWRTNYMTFNYHDNVFRVDIAPITNLLSGGIALSTTTKSTRQDVMAENHVFPLYLDYEEAMKKEIGFGGEGDSMKTFEFKFDESVGKLEVGAPIELSGFQVGSVVNVESDFDSNKTRVRSVVLGLIDTSVFFDYEKSTNAGDGFSNLKKAVAKGLKARLAQSNPLTGSLYIDLVTDKKEKPGVIAEGGTFAKFPTTHSSFDGVMEKVADLIEKLNNLDLEKLLASINTLVDESNPSIQNLLKKLSKTADNINRLTSSKEMKNLPRSLGGSLDEFKETLSSINKLLEGDSSNSVLSAQITTMLRELTSMSKSVQQLTDKLERKPNALLFGDE
jgi:paraquat-inducible protein B